jgi:TorA maturation chaperone TorD
MVSMSENSNNAAFSELAPVRQHMYAFLSSAFVEPPARQGVAGLFSEAFLSGAEALFGPAATAALRACIADAPRERDWEFAARHEFMNLFKVPGAQYVMPYESVYRDTREIEGQCVGGLLMGSSAVAVQKWYHLAAVEVSGEFKDLPDHVGLEMSYLAHLCGKEQEFAARADRARLRRAREMQRDFLASHVVPWVGLLRDRIYEKSQHPYFRLVADMTLEFARRDLATLQDLLGPASGNPIPDYAPVESPAAQGT